MPNWDNAWVTWTSGPGARPFYEVILPSVLRHIPPKGTVADLGAGEGRLSRELLRRGQATVAVDRSPALSTLGPSPNNAIVADVTNLPIADSAFSSAVSCMVLQELERPAAAIEEMSRVVSQDGHILIIVSHPVATMIGEAKTGTISGTYGSRKPYVRTVNRSGQQITFHGYQHSIQDYFQALVNNGIRVSTLEEITWNSSPQWNKLPRFLLIAGRKRSDLPAE